MARSNTANVKFDVREVERLAKDLSKLSGETIGAVTVTDLLDAQTAATAAAARHVQARWNYQLAQSALQRATGTLLGEE